MSSFPKAITHSFTTRLITALIVVIVVTAIVAGIPSYILVRNELQNQTLARVKDGERVTKAFLDAEKARLVNLASHTAQRPTLQRLLQENGGSGLSEYLNNFKTGVGLDVLFISNSSGEFAAGDVNEYACIGTKPTGEAFFYSPACLEDQIVMLATQPLSGDFSDTFNVTVGVFLDDEFAHELARGTGFEQNFLVNERIAATSLAELAEFSEPAQTTDTNLTSQDDITEKIYNGDHYYTIQQPLTNELNEEIAVNEVALLVEGLHAANRRALLILFFSTFVIVLVGSVLGALFARHLTAPLDQLTSAARKIGRGDFSSPISVPDEPYEIATLASAFEESRVNTQQYMDDLTRAKAWSETVIQSIEEGIVTFDDQTIITSFSHGAQKITGWSSEEVCGKPLNEIFRIPEDEGIFSELIPPTGGKSQIEVLTRTGRKTNFAVTVAQLVPTSGENSQTALVLRDVTEEEATQSLRSYFLANISHEFRTPLSALNASVELMLDELDDLSKAEINELLNSIHRSVTGLQTLIDNLLESIRIQAGRYQIHRQTIEFGDVVTDAVGIMKPLLDRRRQFLTLDEPEYYPVAMADPTRMTQVLVNLLSNASKYSPMETTIDLIVDQPDEHTLRVSVADRGLGISPTEREDIFRRFVRLSDQNGAQYGVGLGLSVVKAIVEEHGGEVAVKDHLGGGSIFWFTIPIDGDTA